MPGAGSAPLAPATSLRWRVVLGAVIAAAMTVMDLTMTSAALGSIQHTLNASLAKGALVISANVTAELITLSMSAYLTRAFRPRMYMIVMISCFVGGALLTANAWSFESLLVARVIQGAASGLIMPFAYYLIVAMMDRQEQPKAIAAFSFTVTAAGVLGPVLCITLADWYGWRALYYVSVPVAALALWLALPGLRTTPGGSSRLGRRASLVSIGAAVVGLFCVQYILDVDNVRGWLSSPVLWLAAGTAVATLILFVANELRTRHPLVDLRLLRQGPFTFSCAFNFLAGAAVYASFFMIPYYLTTHGYSVAQVGTVALYGGVAQLAISLTLPLLLRRVDVYLVSAAGALLFSVSALVVFLAGDSPGNGEIVGAQVARSVGAGLLLAALGLMATRALSANAASSGSLLFNIARSLGGSIGTACCAAFVVFRAAHYDATLPVADAPQAGHASRIMALHDTFASAFVVLALLAAILMLGYALRSLRARRGQPTVSGR